MGVNFFLFHPFGEILQVSFDSPAIFGKLGDFLYFSADPPLHNRVVFEMIQKNKDSFDEEKPCEIS